MLIAILTIVIGILFRFIPHAPNFAPVGAIAIFAGIYLSKKWSWSVPIVLMLISDFFIGVYEWKIMASVYACFIFSVVIGRVVRKIKLSLTMSPLTHLTLLLSSSLLGSVVFFLITNAAVVFFGAWYPHTWQGLRDAYVAAIPFFRNTVTSDLFYLFIFTSSYEIATRLARKFAHRSQNFSFIH